MVAYGVFNDMHTHMLRMSWSRMHDVMYSVLGISRFDVGGNPAAENLEDLLLSSVLGVRTTSIISAPGPTMEAHHHALRVATFAKVRSRHYRRINGDAGPLQSSNSTILRSVPSYSVVSHVSEATTCTRVGKRYRVFYGICGVYKYLEPSQLLCFWDRRWKLST